CLVRAPSADAARRRLEGELTRRFAGARQNFTRVELVHGDLSKPFFDLTPEDFRKLASNIDVIYHCGAAINILASYEALKPVNVLGAETILRLASTVRSKAVHFISTFAVFVSPFYLKRASIPEQDALEYWEGLPSGYVQSKWVSERLMA